MLFRKKLLIQLLLCISILFSAKFVAAINLNQIFTLKKDGSGIIRLVYTEKETIVKGKNFVIGNFPFTKDALDEYFNSATNEVYLSEVNKDPNDNSLIVVRVEIKFSDFNKIGEAKGFSNIKMTLTQSDSGNVLTELFTTAFLKSNSIDQIYGVLDYDGKIISTNGKLDGKNAIWFRGKDFVNVTQDIYFVATLESDDEKTTSGDKEEKGKSCGLFGFEFPVIIFLGSALIFANRKKKSSDI